MARRDSRLPTLTRRAACVIIRDGGRGQRCSRRGANEGARAASPTAATDMNPLDPIAIDRACARAAAHYDAHAVLQREVGARLLERLEYLRAPPARVLDLGGGSGRDAAELRRRYPRAEVLLLDRSLPMLRRARPRLGWWRPLRRLCADAAALPLADASIDLLVSNLLLPWVGDVATVLGECRRVLRPGGLLLLSSCGPDTLVELRAAWAAVDAAPHVHGFAPLAALGDALLAAGFRDPVVDVDTYTVTYADVRKLMRDLRAAGATNADRGRRRGLTGKSRLAAVEAAYESQRRDGLLPATVEIITAQAFGPDPGQPRRSADGDLAAIPLDSLRGSRIRR